MIRRRLGRDRRGLAALEFGLIAPVLMLVTFATIEIGFLVPWTKGGLQSVAVLAARCGAVGSPDCANVQTYAVSLANVWVMPGVIAAADVAAVGNATSCGGFAGKFYSVTITCSYFGTGWLPPPFGNNSVTVSACYPMA